jgi:flagellar assembly factor FliW
MNKESVLLDTEPVDMPTRSDPEPEEHQAPTFFFPDGILGFPTCRRFRLAPADLEGFYWLHSTETQPLAFLMVDPFRAIEGFFVDLGDADLHHLQARHAPDIGVLAIVTLPRRPGDTPTANLQGVVALNFAKRIGRQVILQETPYSTRWPLDLQRLSLAS